MQVQTTERMLDREHDEGRKRDDRHPLARLQGERFRVPVR